MVAATGEMFQHLLGQPREHPSDLVWLGDHRTGVPKRTMDRGRIEGQACPKGLNLKRQGRGGCELIRNSRMFDLQKPLYIF